MTAFAARPIDRETQFSVFRLLLQLTYQLFAFQSLTKG